VLVGAFVMVRHAQSTWNALALWQGQADPPLSAVGEEQALGAATLLAQDDPFDLVVSSDLQRARRTAEIVATNLEIPGPVLTLTSLREYDVGEWSGLNREEIEARWPDLLARFDRRERASAPGGEDRAGFDARVQAAAREVAALGASHRAGRILVVSHGGVVRALARAAGLDENSAGQLAGYRGPVRDGTLWPEEPVDLLALPHPATPKQIIL
jgi:probable phosphoglycerate mutase